MQAFLFYAILEAINQDILVFPAREYIYPPYDGEGDKIRPLLVVEFVISAHAVKLVVSILS